MPFDRISNGRNMENNEGEKSNSRDDHFKIQRRENYGDRTTEGFITIVTMNVLLFLMIKSKQISKWCPTKIKEMINNYYKQTDVYCLNITPKYTS